MFNATNIEDPVLPTLSDKTYYSFLPQFQKTMNIYLQRQQATLKDSLFLTSTEDLFFYSMQTIQDSM
jgi:hypothetical protein